MSGVVGDYGWSLGKDRFWGAYMLAVVGMQVQEGVPD